MMLVKHLFVKIEQGSLMHSVTTLDVGPNGIEGNVSCPPLRQVLIVPIQTLREFNLNPGDLRENVVIDGFDLHTLESGTVIEIGRVKVRFTFHCAPCGVIKDKVSIRKIMHKRGVLGSFLNCGSINIGDEIVVKGKRYESIPYHIQDRIKWYLDKQTTAVPVSKLVFDIGLSNSYCRAVPNLVRNRDDINKEMILYRNSSKGKRKKASNTLRMSMFGFDTETTVSTQS